MKIFAIAAAIAAVAATSNAALVPQDVNNENYVTQGAWGGKSPINLVWPLPDDGKTPASWKTTYTKFVPKGTASVSIDAKRAITVTLGADTQYWKAPTVVFEKPTNVKPPTTYKPKPRNDYDDYYTTLEEDEIDDTLALPEDDYKPAYKPRAKGYKPKKGYKQAKPKRETLKCTLKEFTFHSISEHQYMGNNFPLEVEFKHACANETTAVFHQLYNVRYVKPAEPKKPKYKKKSPKGYLESLVAEVYDNKYDTKYKEEEYYPEEDEYYPGDEEDYYYVNKYEESFATATQPEKDEKASNTLRKIANFVAANLIEVTKTGKGYDTVYTPVPSTKSVPIDFKFSIRDLFDVSNGYYGYIGSETYYPWSDAYVFVSGNTLTVDVKVAEFQQFVHALVASIKHPGTDASYADAFPHRYEVYNNRHVRPLLARTVWGYFNKNCTPFWSAPISPIKYTGLKPYRKEKYDYAYSADYDKYEEEEDYYHEDDDYYQEDPYKAPAKY